MTSLSNRNQTQMPTPFTLTEVTTLVTGPVRTANTLKVIAKISSFAAQIC